MTSQSRTLVAWGCLLSALIAAGWLHARIAETELKRGSQKEQDVHFAWVEGARILAAENPYTRILAGDMRYNRLPSA